MRVHKMDPEDFKRVTEFIHACEHMLEGEKFSLKSPYEHWKDWQDDDEDKKGIQAIETFISKNEDMDEVDGRIVAYEYLRKKYTHMLSLLNITAHVLVENCCDINKDYLDFSPEFYTLHVAPEQ